jgi:hypothetical protein
VTVDTVGTQGSESDGVSRHGSARRVIATAVVEGRASDRPLQRVGRRRAPLLVVALRPSWGVAAALAFGHFAAIGVAAVWVEPWPLALCAAIALAAIGAHAMRRDACRLAADSVVTLCLDGSAQLRGVRRDGRTIAGRLRRPSRVWPWAVALEIEVPGARAGAIWIPRDAVEPAAFRALAARLRWGPERPT